MLRSANIVGSGPNGLSAAITLAQRGVAVTVYERNAQVGGAATSAELTLPGFLHDVGSSVYPLGVASPFFRSLPLTAHGLRWIEPPAPLAHPLDDGPSVMLEHDLELTAAQFGDSQSGDGQSGDSRACDHDRRAWRALFSPLVNDWEVLAGQLLHPLLRVPRHPFGLAAFGLEAALPAVTLARLKFRTPRARALLAGNAAHSVLPLERVGSSGVGLTMVAAGHATGWPIIAGGAQALADALAGHLVSLGGRILLNAEIEDLAQLDIADATLFDTGPQAVDRIAGACLTPSFRTRMAHFRYGPGAFKMDWALSQPIPWRDPQTLRAATVHVGGTMEEIATSESAAFHGRQCDRPFVLLAQPSLFDESRAPAGKHTAWAYCHVPNGSTEDRTKAIEAQIERFAPGFRDCILARHSFSPGGLEAWNPNLVGGDVAGGAMTISQLLNRPTAHLYATSNQRLFLCSASTPPGGGVHGMCGHLAAMFTLHQLGSKEQRARSKQ